jgi:ribosomal protein S27AE
MARQTSGGVSRATANTVAAMKRGAEKRRCPKCGRGSALKFHSDDFAFGSYCRWDDCGYERLTIRE